MELICFVILHYNDHATTDRCIRSVLAMEQQERIKIVIVDNDIKEDPQKRKRIWKKYEANPKICVLPLTENGGFSYANNRGYSFAREELGASFILVLNNDIEFVQKNFIEKLEEAYREHPCHVFAPDIVKSSTREHQNPMDTRVRTREEAEYTIRMNRLALRWYSILYPVLYLQNRMAERRQSRSKQSDKEYYGRIQTGIVPFGAGLIFTPGFVSQESKAFEPETKFYYEEYLLAVRCQRKGYRIIYDPSMKLLHETGKATRASFGNEYRRLRFVMEQTAEACEVYLRYLSDMTG